VLALVLALQQPATVTFSHPVASSAVVLEALGEEIGIPVRPTGSLTKDYLLLRFEKVPLPEAYDKLAETLNATWTVSNGVRYLGRTPAQDEAGLRKLQGQLEISVAAYIESDALKVGDWTSTRAVALMRDHVLSDGSLDRTAATETSNAKGPCREMLDDFVRSIGAKRLAGLPNDKETVFRWQPRKGEQQIPLVLRATAERFVRNVERFGEGMASLGVPLHGDFDLPGEVRLASGRGLSPDWIAFRATVRSGRLYVSMTANGDSPASYAHTTVQASRDPGAAGRAAAVEAPYAPSALALAVGKRLDARQGETVFRLDVSTPEGKEVYDWFQAGLAPDPMHLFVGEPLLQAAEATGANVVAQVPDTLFFGATVAAYAGRPLGDLLQALDVQLSEDGRWLTKHPPLDATGAFRLDRPAVARLALETYERGWSTIETLAKFATTCENGSAWQAGRRLASVLQPVPYSRTWLMDEPTLRSLKFFASLPSAARAQATKGWVVFPFEDLPSNVRRGLVETVELRGFGRARMNFSADNVAWTEWAYTGYFAGEVAPAASELQGSKLEVLVESKELVAAQERVEGNRRFGSAMMNAQEAAMAIVGQRGASGPGVDFSTLAAFNCERLQMRVRLADGESLYFVFTTDSRNSETRYYPVAQLPGAMGEAVRADLKRLGG
jgi:hypothetical protein